MLESTVADLTHNTLGPQLWLLQPYLLPETALLEIGPGDCSLSMTLAKQVRQVYGLDVSEKTTDRASLPPNLKLILSDGTSIPLRQHFDPVATGFYLKEYTVRELTRLFKQVGFRIVKTLLGRQGAFVRAPVGPVVAAETALGLVPRRARRVLGRTVGRAFLGVRLLGTK